jgi:pimeloyl-ACP methyl ester carboxylesterase
VTLDMKTLSIVSAVLGIALTQLAVAGVKNIVLVHGAFADGSGWRPVATILEHDGYTAYVVQEPLTSWDADLAATRSVLDRAGPCVLVGHSWAGMIITEVGDRPSVRSLVYVAAFEPDIGETAGALQEKTPPAGGKSVVPSGGGFVYVKPEAFATDFAGGVPKATAHFMEISQVPIAADSFNAKVTVAAWSKKPSFAVIHNGIARSIPISNDSWPAGPNPRRSSCREATSFFLCTPRRSPSSSKRRPRPRTDEPLIQC